MKTARVVLMVLVAAVLAAGTILERVNPAWRIYSQWWFVVLMALVGVAALVSIMQGKMWRRPALCLVHASVAVILLGGGLTTWTGKSGEMLLHPSTPSHTVESEDGSQWELPFDITLGSFEKVNYAGTHTPMDFVSHVTVEGKRFDISMNHILRHRGYRFYQSDFDDDGSSVLSVSRDPWGIGTTYAGYAMMILGILGLMVAPDGRFRRLLRGVAVAAVMLLPALDTAAAPRTLPRDAAESMGRMYVLYKGRVCPMQTLAKDFTTKLTGKATYKGLTAEQVLSGYLFYYSDWADEPAIKVKGAKELNLDKHSSFNQLQVLDGVRQAPSTSKNTRSNTEKLNLVRMLLSGKMLKLFPVEGGWYGQNDDLPPSVNDDEYIFIRRWQSYCQEQVTLGNMEELKHIFEKTQEYQVKRIDINHRRMRAERAYNALTTGRWLAMLGITLGLICFAYSIICQSRNQKQRRWVRIAMACLVAALTIFLLIVFILRWIVGGHIPMAGGFDTMNLMSIVIGILALALMHRSPISLPVGMLAMGFCQLVAMMSGSNPPVTNLMPVLNSPLLTLHVAVIMGAYALFLFVALLSVAGLITGKENYRRSNLLLLYPAVFLLALGIIIGAVWANVSWGTYWSWDPKEVWALVTLIVYTLPLHPGILSRPRAFYLYCLLALLSVVVTYFGVNLILGGMHAYN